MSEIPCTNPGESPDENAPIEVHLTGECTRQLLRGSLERTRRRTAGLLADLMTAARATEPAPERIRQLADSIDFERRLARQIRLAMVGAGKPADS